MPIQSLTSVDAVQPADRHDCFDLYLWTVVLVFQRHHHQTVERHCSSPVEGWGFHAGAEYPSCMHIWMHLFRNNQCAEFRIIRPVPMKWILQRYMYRVLTQMTPPQFLRNNAFIYPWHDLHRRARPRAISAGPTRVHWTEFAGIDTIYPNVLAFFGIWASLGHHDSDLQGLVYPRWSTKYECSFVLDGPYRFGTCSASGPSSFELC